MISSATCARPTRGCGHSVLRRHKRGKPNPAATRRRGTRRHDKT